MTRICNHVTDVSKKIDFNAHASHAFLYVFETNYLKTEKERKKAPGSWTGVSRIFKMNA